MNHSTPTHWEQDTPYGCGCPRPQTAYRIHVIIISSHVFILHRLKYLQKVSCGYQNGTNIKQTVIHSSGFRNWRDIYSHKHRFSSYFKNHISRRPKKMICYITWYLKNTENHFEGLDYMASVLYLTWWRHQMETFSALLALCAGNSPIPVNSPHKGQWRGARMFSFIYAWINDWVNNREAGNLRRQHGHYDVILM